MENKGIFIGLGILLGFCICAACILSGHQKEKVSWNNKQEKPPTSSYTTEEEEDSLSVDTVVADTTTKPFKKGEMHIPITVKQLPGSTNPLPMFTRVQKEIHARFNSAVIQGFCVDFPDSSMSHRDAIMAWLIDVIDTSTDPNIIVEGYIPATRKSQYTGDTNDPDAITQYITNRYFKSQHDEYGEDSTCYPYMLYCSVDMQAVIANDRLITYRKYVDRYYGGVHGIYSETLISFDPVLQTEINWTHLFKPQYKKKVWNLIIEAAMHDKHYAQCERTDSKKVVEAKFLKKSRDGEPTSQYIDVSLGLGNSGVVFSFQPYALSCFAAGAFHFTIPYEKLMPYFTDDGLWCVEKMH